MPDNLPPLRVPFLAEVQAALYVGSGCTLCGEIGLAFKIDKELLWISLDVQGAEQLAIGISKALEYQKTLKQNAN